VNVAFALLISILFFLQDSMSQCLGMHTLVIFHLNFLSQLWPLNGIFFSKINLSAGGFSETSQDCLSRLLIVHSILFFFPLELFWHSYGPLMVNVWVK
jgi:hypothetical protein